MSIVYDFRAMPDFVSTPKVSAREIDRQAIRHDINAAMAATNVNGGPFTVDGIHLILDNVIPGTSRNT